MVDKGHCKIAYGTMKDRLEVAEFYNFEKSYPDHEERKRRREERRAEKKRRKEAEKEDMDVDEEGGVNGKDDDDVEEGGEGDEWEDTDDEDAEIDEVVDAVPSSDSETDSDSDSELDEEDYAPSSQITYGDSPYELVLPSGARIGHRSLKRYYDQHFSLASLNRNSDVDGDEDPRKSGAALVRKLLADKTSMLVPRKGGFGAFGEGTDVVKARNRGEAKEAGRHTKEFRDMKRREAFKTKIGYRNNHQKHYRDPLLQVSILDSPLEEGRILSLCLRQSVGLANLLFLLL